MSVFYVLPQVTFLHFIQLRITEFRSYVNNCGLPGYVLWNVAQYLRPRQKQQNNQT